MNKIIVAIGGGENGRTLENGKKTIYDTKDLEKVNTIIIDEEYLAICVGFPYNMFETIHKGGLTLDR